MLLLTTFSDLLFFILDDADFLKSGDFIAEEFLRSWDMGTSILFLITKHTPKIEFSRLKKPISIERAINSIIPGRIASHNESLKFLYGCDIAEQSN